MDAFFLILSLSLSLTFFPQKSGLFANTCIIINYERYICEYKMPDRSLYALCAVGMFEGSRNFG